MVISERNRYLIHSKNPREAAYLALRVSASDNLFVSDVLEDWRIRQQIEVKDFHLAREIACGATRMALALDEIAVQLSGKDRLSLKPKEKALIRIALYQKFYMDKIPDYALVNEAVELAKKYCHATFVRFLNALLRKLSTATPSLPSGNAPAALSVRYSYPKEFVEFLLVDYGLEAAIQILQAGNVPGIHMARIRSPLQNYLPAGTVQFSDSEAPMVIIEDSALIPTIAQSPDYYIQNATTAEWMVKLSKGSRNPERILDLCCSPGGKLVAAHDLFPDAELAGNDVSEEKLKRIQQNCLKYGIQASLYCSRGENYTSTVPYDLVIVDAPCSNSGVFNKRPEARWRFSESSLQSLRELQLALLKNAKKLMHPRGEIWYLTCSILKRENEELAAEACAELSLKRRFQETRLPGLMGWDGGFACALVSVS